MTSRSSFEGLIGWVYKVAVIRLGRYLKTVKIGSGTWVEKYFETSQSIRIVPKTNEVSSVQIIPEYVVIF